MFEEKIKDLETKGITVTHTSPADGFVEVGITPFNEENQDFILEILGSDEVKVVDGIMAVTYTDELMSTTFVVDGEPLIASDAATSELYDPSIAEAQVVSAPQEAADANVISTQEDLKDEEKGVSPIAMAAGAAALLGLGAVIFKKKTV